MRTHLKTLAVAGLTLALLGWFFRQADVSQVWREIREAEAVGAGAAARGSPGSRISCGRCAGSSCCGPSGRRACALAFRTTVIGFAANTVLPAARRRVRPAVSAGAQRGAERSGGIHDHYPRTSPRLRHGARAVRRLRASSSIPASTTSTARSIAGVKAGGLLGAAAAGAVLLVLVLNAVRPALTHRLVDFCLRPLPERFRGPRLGPGLRPARRPGGDPRPAAASPRPWRCRFRCGSRSPPASGW